MGTESRIFEKFPWERETTTADHWRVILETDGPAHAEDQRRQVLHVERPSTNDGIPENRAMCPLSLESDSLPRRLLL